MADWLLEIQDSLQQVKITAETTLNLGTNLQEENHVQWEEINSVWEKLILMDFSTHQCNLKFRGLTEGLENVSDLILFMGLWFAGLMQLGD